jgi:hypothetical protein
MADFETVPIHFKVSIGERTYEGEVEVPGQPEIGVLGGIFGTSYKYGSRRGA